MPGMETRHRARLRLLSLGAMLALTAGGSASFARPRPLPASVIALTSATARWRQLSTDARRRQRRTAWLRVIAALEQVGHSASGPTAALALLRAGHAAQELSRWSGQLADVRRAERLDLASAAANPHGSLADDALMDAAHLEQERLHEPAIARRTLGRAAALHGDRRADALRLIAQLPAAARRMVAKAKKPGVFRPSAQARAAGGAALDQATAELRRLEALPAKKQQREAWTKVIHRLEAAGQALQPTAKGALAFLRAGRAAQTLAGFSQRSADLRRAVALDLEAPRRCPGASVDDDALVAAATLEAGRLADPAGARRHLEEAIALGGDCARQARDEARALDRLRSPALPARTADLDLPPPPLPPDLDPAPRAKAPRANSPRAIATRTSAAETRMLAANVRALQKKALADTTWSLSDQVGLKVRRIIVDPGHGGHDTGAIGPTGAYEKNVTLAVAKHLAADLEARGYQVVLTRDSDRFVSLEERTRIASRAKGDLFISIHANAARSRRLHGVETFSLNVASDRYAMRLAARENASTERPQSDLKFLLADLATRADTVDSDRLARDVQESVVHRVARRFGRPKDLGVKHALFYVLLGAKMPAVLVETAFLSNRAEEKKLTSPRYQAALGAAIADGVDRFVARRSQLASIQN